MNHGDRVTSTTHTPNYPGETNAINPGDTGTITHPNIGEGHGVTFDHAPDSPTWMGPGDIKPA